MYLYNLAIDYIAHASFRFRSPAGVTILADPFFASGFWWCGHFETFLTPPRILPEDIEKCTAIFVSHNHGDHFDPDAIKIIHEKTKCEIFACQEVLEDLFNKGFDSKYLVKIENNMKVEREDLQLAFLSGYDNSLDEQGRANKFSMLIKIEEASIFYSGDCHQLPPQLKGEHVDAVISWPHTTDEKLIEFCNSLNFAKFILMHGGRFTPGDFHCNFDYSIQKKRIEELTTDIEVIIPSKIKST